MKSMRFKWVLIFWSMFLSWMVSGNEGVKEEVLLSPQNFREACRSREGALLDVRTPEEYRDMRLEGARLINYYDRDFKQKIKLGKKHLIKLGDKMA